MSINEKIYEDNTAIKLSDEKLDEIEKDVEKLILNVIEMPVKDILKTEVSEKIKENGENLKNLKIIIDGVKSKVEGVSTKLEETAEELSTEINNLENKINKNSQLYLEEFKNTYEILNKKIRINFWLNFINIIILLIIAFIAFYFK